MDLDSENSHSIDTVHCIIAGEEVIEDHAASTPANIENDDFIDLVHRLLVIHLQSQVVALSTLTWIVYIYKMIQLAHLLQVLSAISRRQVIYLMMLLAESSVPGNTSLWCYCEQDKPKESMVGCDNPACQIEWFHLSCLRLTVEQLPRGKWFFPECHKSRLQLRSKKRTTK